VSREGGRAEPRRLTRVPGPTWIAGVVLAIHGVPLSWPKDTPGPLGRTVEDAASLLQAIAGYDPKDPLSSREPVPDYARTLADGVRGLRIGIIRELTFGPRPTPKCAAPSSRRRGRLERLGAVTDEISLPSSRSPARSSWRSPTPTGPACTFAGCVRARRTTTRARGAVS